MKPSRLLLLPVFGFLLLVSSAQQDPPTLHITTPTTWEADWAGEPHRVYFAQWSADLENWVYLPTMKFGEEMHGIGAEVSAGTGFLRLNYYDDPTLADLDAAKAADFDEDGISNWEEVTGTSTNPTNVDSDGDGLPDGWETAHGLDPNDDGSTDPQNGASGSFQGGQTTNGSAHSQGVQADPNATLEDEDGDGLSNESDAEPDDGEINWEKTPEASYVWIPQVEKTGATAASRHGHIFFPDYTDFFSTIEELEILWDSNTSAWVDMPANGSWSDSGLTLLNASQVFDAAWENITDMNDNGTVVGQSTFWNIDTGHSIPDSALMVWEMAGGSTTDQYGSPTYLVPSSEYVTDGKFLSVWTSPRIADDGTVSSEAYKNVNIVENFVWVVKMTDAGIHCNEMNEWLTLDIPSYGYTGAILDHETGLFIQSDSDPAKYFLRYRDGGDAESLEGLLTDTTETITDTDIARTPPPEGSEQGRVWFSVKRDSGNSVFLEKRAGGSGVSRWHKPASMAEGAIRLNARGEAITPTKVWRNGTYTAINDLVAKPESSDLSVTKLIDLASNGLILAEATEDGVTKTGLIIPIEVSWEEFAGYENVSDHIDPWITPETTNGKRIFPGAKNPDEPAILDKLELVVKTLPSQAGKTVYVKAFDVDDTTDEGFDVDEVIDSHNKAGDDNLEDYKQTPENGQFWTGSAWGNNESNAVIDSNGEARFTFGVGMQPGNNYRVVVSLDDASPLADIQVSDPEAPHYLGSEPQTTPGLPHSPLLTVWRRLWVENDSMEAIPTHEFDYKANDLSWDLGDNNHIISGGDVYEGGSETSFHIPDISDVSSFKDLDNGKFIIQGVSHPVLDTLIGYQQVNDPSSTIFIVTVAGDLSATPLGSGFRLYDDDDFGLAAPALPRNDLVNEQMKVYFKPAFVEITDAKDYNHDELVPFRPNEDVSTNLYGIASTVVADAKELDDRPTLWVAPLTAAYQGPEQNDKDPALGGETLRDGESATYGEYDHSTVFVEASRENYEHLLRSSNPSSNALALQSIPKWMVAVASHEIAHQPGEQTELQDHEEGGLLGASMGNVTPFNPENSKFKPATIKRFRKATRWSK